MTECPDIDFDGIRAELVAAITAITRAIDALKSDHSNPAVYARVDLGHIVADLRRGHDLLNQTEQILEGAT